MSSREFLEREQEVTLTNCDTEPIHIPGSIQPHGVLLALQEPDFIIVQMSENTQDILGIAPEVLLQHSLSTLIEASQLASLTQQLAIPDVRFVNPLKIEVGERVFDGIVHRVDGVLVLELEPAHERLSLPFPSFYHAVRASATRLQEAQSLQQLTQVAASEVRALTGFDRVMVYRFHEDWHGEVIAEAKRDDKKPYLGLHYPASDIPVQARELYRRNWLRLIADVSYRPVPIIPTDNPRTGEPLDLSASVLRSVSPMHIEYLKNMGVGASMSVSIIKDGQLWGLISCHHDSAKYVPYEIRTACEFLGQILSLQLATKEDHEEYALRAHVKDIQVHIQEHLLRSEYVLASLTQDASLLMELVNAQGVILYLNEQYCAFGETPDEEEGRRLLRWLHDTTTDDVFVTNALTQVYAEAQSIKAVASGVLALSIARVQGDYVVWFRPEVLQTVQWGGDPEQAMQRKADNILHPRHSFDVWSQTVRDTSLPWKPFEIEVARGLRSVIVDRVLRAVMVQRASELATLNAKLERSNNELDAFTYVASHDLKEPLRGIRNYALILKEDYAKHLDSSGLTKVNTLVRLAERMNDLIDSLLHYSRVGQIDLSFAETNLNDVLLQTLDMLSVQIEERHIEIRVPRPLPRVYCDRIRIGEVFSNLLTNAIKYSDKAQSWIEIGYEESALVSNESDAEHEQVVRPIVFYVRDNGIGIREKYFSTIFRMFKRLHGRDAYSGGTGAGLTIAKRIVERHGGTLWVTSTYGEGSTFYFTLQKGI